MTNDVLPKPLLTLVPPVDSVNTVRTGGTSAFVDELPVFTALGLDPGLAWTGISAIGVFADGRLCTQGVILSHTEKVRDKPAARIRASADTQRRLELHANAIVHAIQTVKPSVIGIENYTIYEPHEITRLKAAAARAGDALSTDEAAFSELKDAARAAEKSGTGLGQSSKTIAVCGAAEVIGHLMGIPVIVFEPHDRTRHIGGRSGASKQEVGAAVTRWVFGLEAVIAAKVKAASQREHVWDATAYAILAACEYAGLRPELGVMDPMIRREQNVQHAR